MYLPAVMDVVQEEMGEQVADPLRNDTCLAAIRCDPPIEVGIQQAVAEGDQLAVELSCASARSFASPYGLKRVPTARPTPRSSSMSK